MTTEKIKETWEASNFTPPTNYLLLNDDEYYSIIDDSTIIYRAANRYGQIISVVNKYCNLINGTYHCQGPTHITSCRSLNPLDQFVVDSIIPLIHPPDQE